MKKLFYIAISSVLLFISAKGNAQKIIKGKIIDSHSEEVVPFASVTLKSSGIGVMSDSAGNFSFTVYEFSTDTLSITTVGYETFYQKLKWADNLSSLLIKLERKTYNDGVVVRVKIDKGLYVWRNIVKHKPENNRFQRFSNFGYELYNKLELDLKNFKSLQRVTSIKPLKPVNDLINLNIDSSEGPKVLPAYLTESLSDYYWQKKPVKRREEIKAVNTNGIKNESMIKFLGGMDQVINIYSNFIPVLGKEFISPISDNGDFYYKYAVADTQKVGNKRYYHLIFTPRRKGMNTFEGDCWVEAGSFAIQKMNLRLDKSADINFLERLSLIQEFSKINDSTWFIARDKFVADVTPLSNKVPGLIGRKTSTYRNVITDDSLVSKKLLLNTTLEEIIPAKEATAKTKYFWDTARHESLTNTEKSIIRMMDTILNTPSYQRLTKQIGLIGTGYIDVGNVELGSMYNWFTGNSYEGFRMRFDIASNKYFNKQFRWHTYLAYGFQDKKFKGEIELFYLPRKDPRQYWSASYRNDLDHGQHYFGEISSDNIFALAIRKPNIPVKFITLEETKIEFFNEWKNGFSILPSFSNRTYTPLRNLVPQDSFAAQGTKRPLTTSEFSIRLRYAFLEKFIESHFYRTSLGSTYPIVEATYTKGFSGLLSSKYDYHKIAASISDWINTPPFGYISYRLYAGKTFGNVPYTFLDIAPGNELYYYNKYAFNMMNRYEFIHDQYAGAYFEHNIGNGIFKIAPRLKFRQFYTVKALWGSLSDANRQLNFKEGHNFQSLNGKTYLEIGTGIDNILRFFRIDFIWRVLPKSDIKKTTEKFGIFGSLRFNF